MSAVAAANQLPFTGGAPIQHGVDELAEYEKILRLRDAVFAGSHPRLTVPTNAVRKVSPRATQAPSQTLPSVPPSTAPPYLGVQLPGLQLNLPTEHAPTTLNMPNGTPSISRSDPPASAASELDPIFLTKPDVLVRAEAQLHRQRIERALREQLEGKKKDARHKTSPQEAKPDFDVSDVLSKALEIAKPVTFESSHNANDNGSASDSFDENSFYSSKAPDSTPRDRLVSPTTKHQVQPMDVDDLDADGARQVDLMNSPYKVNPRPPFRGGHPYQRHEPSDLTAMQIDDEDDEPEYSPPEPVEHFAARSAGSNGNQSFDHQSRRLNPRSSGQYQNGRTYESPPETDTRIQVQSRKKRKLDKKGGRKRGAVSPDAFIKNEPVSPPPFHQAQPLGSVRPLPSSDRPIYIDIDPPPPREIRYPAEPLRGEPNLRHAIYDVESPIVRSEPRPLSRSDGHHNPRDDQDLRRVASLQRLRSAPQRQDLEPIYQTPSRVSRAPSQVPIGGSELRSYREPVQTYQQSAIRDDRIIQSPVYREPEPEVQYEPAPMPPPQKRIVVDQYGNEFYEIVQPRRTVAAQSMRPLETASYGESVVMRNTSLRAPSVVRASYPDDRYVQEMPPPQTNSRRVTDMPRSIAPEARHEPRPVQRSASVAPADYPPRQQMYIDDRLAPREAARMSSVRPGTVRYDDRPEMIQRVQSVRPEGREMSIFVDDRPQVRREYVPVERPVYEVRRPVQNGGYYEVDENGAMILDEPAGNNRRYVTQRY